MIEGSSPLTRGKPDQRRGHALGVGLIPTHAGKTHPRRATKRAQRAHPHSRGENTYKRTGSTLSPGSSPLTRGKLRVGLCRARELGLIPTHAGKTGADRRRRPPARAHPHSRGENNGLRTWCRQWSGSSPLTRGKQPACRAASRTRRLIPTHAGKTGSRWRTGSSGGAHPHSRGENRAPRRASCAHDGSSPLTRGKRMGAPTVGVIKGLIPTHAGKTRWANPPGNSGPAHPHSRGENSPAP